MRVTAALHRSTCLYRHKWCTWRRNGELRRNSTLVFFTLCGETGCYGVAHWHGCCRRHLSVGCGGVRDERRHRSTSEWLISSELCCPTSECASTHPHTHSLQTFNNAVWAIDTFWGVFSVFVLVCFWWKVLQCAWYLLISAVCSTTWQTLLTHC